MAKGGYNVAGAAAQLAWDVMAQRSGKRLRTRCLTSAALFWQAVGALHWLLTVTRHAFTTSALEKALRSTLGAGFS